MLKAEDVMHRAEEAGQGHLFSNWKAMSPQEQQNLLHQVEGLDLDELNQIFKSSTVAPGRPVLAAKESDDFKWTVVGVQQWEPAQNITQLKDMTVEQRRHWKSVGLELINQGKVAVVILAGGQGTRLGSAQPKGCYDVGLPSGKSLFQIHCERIQRIQHLARQHGGGEGKIYVYFMTSLHTHHQTVAFFKAADFFGLDADQVKFFQQGTMPCFTEEGKIIMAAHSTVELSQTIAVSPNGNGGIYKALEASGSLLEMQNSGVSCIDCFSVDNLLAKPADPLFLGHCWEANTFCGPPKNLNEASLPTEWHLGARVVAKAYPDEKVGVFVSHHNKAQVVEYSELSLEMAHARDEHTQQLQFNWGNTCMHFFRLDFLRRVAQMQLPYHIAHKSIPSCGTHIQATPPAAVLPNDCFKQGIKLEMFIFDVFPLAEAVSLLEVSREAHYAPIKNPPGAPTDSADTARNALFALHRRSSPAAPLLNTDLVVVGWKLLVEA